MIIESKFLFSCQPLLGKLSAKAFANAYRPTSRNNLFNPCGSDFTAISPSNPCVTKPPVLCSDEEQKALSKNSPKSPPSLHGRSRRESLRLYLWASPVGKKREGFIAFAEWSVFLLEFEVDVDRVGIAVAKSGGEGVDAGHTVEGGEHGLVHEWVAAGADYFSAGNGAVALNLDFDGADEGFVLFEDGCGLFPLAEEAVVDEFVIPTELAGRATRSAFARACGGGTAARAGCAGLG